MHLNLTPEALLIQLGYTKNEYTLKQINKIIDNTEGFESFSQHILSFNDALIVEKGFVAMSNSEEYFKIKCEEDYSADNLSAFTKMVKHWADKYKIELRKLDNKNTYYIIGQK